MGRSGKEEGKEEEGRRSEWGVWNAVKERTKSSKENNRHRDK